MNARAVQPILLVEDTRSLAMLYESVLRSAGYEVECAYLAEEAAEKHKGAEGRLVLLDLMLPDGDGLDLLTDMRAADPGGKVIVVTANGSINRAVSAMRGGAFDFLVKPFDERRLLSAVDNALEEIAKSGSGPRKPARPETSVFHGFIGGSPVMRDVYRLIGEIGRSTATVFITGESGSGKEVAAQAIHAESGRARGPFIALNCGAIPRDLLESEVFGHLKGSFTGAIADKPGAAAAADGGTLFLDEVCEMDLALQTKLLRFLQTSTVTPVGATTPRKVDARIICATNRNPVEEVRAGRFREDLFYRLHVVPIHLPPLRERGDDVIEAAEAFLARYSEQEGKRFTALSPCLKARLRALPWPGNVRQLQNVIWNVVLLHDAEVATESMLPAGLLEESLTPPRPADGAPPMVEEQPLSARVEPLVGATMAEIEREFIEATIAAHGGSIPKAARVLDLSPSTIYRKREGWTKENA
ncbi:sigma-54 dependent transcriptional regulator [Pikeienuella sp. HZG-20]|uniref:sigma-54-dependent transcriptional regulator n=1 Tax=Paludibacillus litoralis TaxID=3133267 RepID=UPI0030EE0F50